VLLVPLALAADPEVDWIAAAAGQSARDEGIDAFASMAPEAASRAALMGACPTPLLAVECSRDASSLAVRYDLRPSFTLAAGTLAPDNRSGDAEARLLSPRLGLRGALYAGPFVARFTGAGGIDAIDDVDGAYVIPEAWAGVDTGQGWLGFGRQDRWLGPGRHGTIALSNNAVAPWMVNGGGDGRLPGVASKAGRFRGELGVGWLGEPRTDVANPGLLLMDLRYMPVPQVEIGATRLSIFGGEGRPDVDIGQLIVPSEPHVYDDPDLVLPDQNELANIHVRVSLPLRKWIGGPVHHVEGWWEYGGEDMIMRDVGGLEYPALAGVGNLYGGEVSLRPVVVTAEYSRLMDDYFRWYVGHRVYHEGFQQDGRVMGHFGGPDSETMWAQVAYWGEGWRGRLWGDWVHRVGVVEARNDRLFTFPTAEQGYRGGLAADVRWQGGWYTLSYELGSVSGRDFVPGNDAVEHRVLAGLAVGPSLSSN